MAPGNDRNARSKQRVSGRLGRRPDGATNAVTRTPNWDAMSHKGFRLASTRQSITSACPTANGKFRSRTYESGAGRIVLQDLPRVAAIADGSLVVDPKLVSFQMPCEKAVAQHLVGLMSPGGVHSHQTRSPRSQRCWTRQACLSVYMRCWTAAIRRRLPPRNISRLQKRPATQKSGRFAVIMPAMDRDKRWDRVTRAYKLLVDAHGEQAAMRSPP